MSLGFVWGKRLFVIVLIWFVNFFLIWLFVVIMLILMWFLFIYRVENLFISCLLNLVRSILYEC